MNVALLLSRTAARLGERDAVFVGHRAVATWAGLNERAQRLGGFLGGRAHDERGTSRVAIVSENCAEFLEILFGVWAAGMTAVPINAKLHPREVAQVLDDAGASLAFVSPAIAASMDAALGAAGDSGCIRLVIGSPDYAAVFAGAPAGIADVPPEAIAWLFYTSGTTGRSKGAMLSHRSLMAATLAHLADIECLDDGMSQVHGAPMSHGSGLYILAYVARGARQVVPASRTFDAAEFLDLCDRHPGCGAFLAPTMVQRLRLAIEAGAPRPRGLRQIVYGGGPMYVADLKRSLLTFGPVFVQIYGQGESPMTITSLDLADHRSDDDAVLGSVGRARTGVEVAVVDGDGRRLGIGESGEVVCRGDVVMNGYRNDPEATADTLRNGWLHTGDIGSLDSRGYLTLRDRSKDVVISGGSNVYPREVEEALLAHVAVREAAVIGQADAEWGEVVVAFVVLGAGQAATAPDLDAWCIDRIARFKKPKRYRFVPDLPRNSYGKVLKRELRATLATDQQETT